VLTGNASQTEQIGFPLFESGLLPPDSVVRKAINAYGGSFASFDVLNNRTTFVTNNGLAIMVAAELSKQETIAREFGYLLRLKDNFPKMVVSNERPFENTYEGITHFYIKDFLSSTLTPTII